MDNPVISVIMGVYSREDTDKQLLEAVRSILDQSFSDYEFIIYDDGSVPKRAQYIKSLEALDSRIIVIGREQNRGLAFSLNECIGITKGKYIARMDADDISLKNRLLEQYRFLEEHPEYSWVGSNAYVFDEDGIWGERKYPEIPEKKDFLKYSPYIHPSVMYRTEIFKKEDGYQVSESTLRCEDYELFMRLRQLGYRGYNIQESLFCYRENPKSFSKRRMRFRINETRVRYRGFRKLGILFPVGWLFVLRPILGGFVPNRLLVWLKRKESEYRK